MREKKGLTQRRLAHDLGISQNYIPAIEANSQQAGPKLQQQMVNTSAVASRIFCDRARQLRDRARAGP
jgi:DNA-binding XRE family transcriptional regulator